MPKAQVTKTRSCVSSSENSVAAGFVYRQECLLLDLALRSDHSTLGFCINGAASKVDAYHGLIANNPGVMSLRDLADVSRTELRFRAVVHANAQPSREKIREMMNLAAIGVRHRLDRFRPAPAWFKGGAHGLQLTKIEDLRFSVGDGSCFIGDIK